MSALTSLIDSFRGDRGLVSSLVGTFGLRLASRALSLAAGLVLARALGAASYGTFAYAITWLGLLVVPTTLGLDYVLVRFVSAYQAQGLWGGINGVLRFSNYLGIAAAVVVTGIALAVVATLPGLDGALRTTLLIVLATLPLAVLTQMWQAALRGLQKVIQGQISEALVQPLVLLAVVGLGVLLFGFPADSRQMALVHIASVGAAFLVVAFFYVRYRPRQAKDVGAIYEHRQWMAMVPPLVFIGGLQILLNRVDILMLGSLVEPEDVGAYFVASRVAEVVLFMTDAVVWVGNPIVARLYASGDIPQLQRKVSYFARVNLLFAAPVFLLMFFGASWILGWFGPEFVVADNSLRVLVTAHLIAAAAGLGAQTLYMTGHQRDAAIVMALSAALNVGLNAALIPAFGILGAAVATGTSLVVFRILAVAFIYKRVGVVSTIHHFGLSKER